MRISDWSSDVCSSDLVVGAVDLDRADVAAGVFQLATLHQPGWVEVVAPRHERPAADAGADAVDGLRRLRRGKQIVSQIGRAHVRTPVTNAHLVCRLLLEKKHTTP